MESADKCGKCCRQAEVALGLYTMRMTAADKHGLTECLLTDMFWLQHWLIGVMVAVLHGAEHCFQSGPGTEPEPEIGTVGTVFFRNRSRNYRNRFSGTETGTRPFCYNSTAETQENFFPQRNRWNRKPELLKRSRARTVTEPNRGHPVFCILLHAIKAARRDPKESEAPPSPS